MNDYMRSFAVGYLEVGKRCLITTFNWISLHRPESSNTDGALLHPSKPSFALSQQHLHHSLGHDSTADRTTQIFAVLATGYLNMPTSAPANVSRQDPAPTYPRSAPD